MEVLLEVRFLVPILNKSLLVCQDLAYTVDPVHFFLISVISSHRIPSHRVDANFQIFKIMEKGV